MMSEEFSHRRINRRRRSKNSILLYGLIALAVLAAGIFWYQNSRYQYLIETPVDPADTRQLSLIIKQGDTLNQVGAKLKDKDLILEEGAFSRYLKEKDLDRNIVAGRFLLSRSQTIPKIAETITNNKNSQSVVTIPEGTTIKGIDDRLAGLNLISAGEFINAAKNFDGYGKYPFLDKEKNKKMIYPLEGFLFPDTYFVDTADFKPEDLISMMLNNFAKKTADLYSGEVDIFGEKHSFFELVTMASMVEKEVRTAKDLPIVAGILWKRVDSNWQLGVDATLLYLNQDDREISYNDLQQENPYNTRKKTGLPPGPICNPGLASIKAALNPEKTPYFYYLNKPDSGEVVYATTNDEHNLNKAKYL